MTDHADVIREALEYVAMTEVHRDALAALDALETAEAERDEARAENSRLRGIAHTNAPVIRDLGARADIAEARVTELEAAASEAIYAMEQADYTALGCNEAMRVLVAALAKVRRTPMSDHAGRFPWATWSDLADRVEAAEAERDSVILAQSAINAQAERAEARVTELKAALLGLLESETVGPRARPRMESIARTAIAKEDTDE